MKTKAVTAVAEDEDEPRKTRSSRSKRRASTDSESPPRKRSKKSSKRTADKKSKRGKVSSSSSRRRRRRSPSPSPSLSSSSPLSVSRSCSTCSSSSSERSVSPPPRSRSRDVKKRKGRGRDRERDPKRRKAWRSTSASSTSSSGSSQSRSKSSKRRTKDGTTRDKIGKDYENVTDSFDRDEEALVDKKGRYEIERYEKNVSLEKVENPPSKDSNETEDVLPAAGGGSPVAEDLELILRQKALENFMKFRAAAAMAGKTDNGATRKETLTDSPQNAGAKVTEARSAAANPFRRQASSLGARHPTESPKAEDCGNGTSPWMQNSRAGMSHGAGSPNRILKDGDTGGSDQQEGSIPEAKAHSTFQPRSPQDGWNSRSVMQRLVNTPGSSSSVNRRLGSSAGVRRVNGAPRIKSIVSIPSREGLDGGTTLQRHCENSAPVESSGEVRSTPIDISSKAEGTNGDDRKTSEPSASNGSILSSADGKRQVSESRIEDKDGGSQLQKKTFSRMHDGETVEVSYKVYIPKKTPALARRKLQR